MSGSVFRFFNPDGPKEDPVQKRRGQLRRAQRSYRDRKEKYTKLLETELGQTRANEAKLMRECEELRTNLQNALDLLSLYKINSPPETTEVSPLSTEELYHSLPEIDTLPQLLSPVSFTPHAGEGNAIEHSSVMPNDKRYTLWPTMGRNSAKVCDMEEITVGMEFVLKIEEPCLGHIHGDPNKPEEPNGHALTASSQLLCISSCDTATTADWRPVPPSPTPLYRNAPAAILDRLLKLAPDLSSEGELTPIQAWNSIRSRPQYGGLDVQRLHRLAENLRKAVKCHGFGAVVQKSVFENLVYQTMTLGQSF